MNAFWMVLIGLGPLLLFAFIWAFVFNLLGHLSGWRELAKVYRDIDARLGERDTTLRFQSARIGYVDYNNCLTIKLNTAGFRLSMLPMFHFGHPPLFIPWDDCHNPQEVKRWVTSSVRFEIGDPQITTILMPLAILEHKPVE